MLKISYFTKFDSKSEIDSLDQNCGPKYDPEICGVKKWWRKK